MTTWSSRSRCPLVSLAVQSYFIKIFTVFAMVTAMAPFAHAAPAATATSLAISATTVPYQTPITLTATVTSGGSPVSTGIVLFCDATAKYCENNSALGIAQVNRLNATAVVKLGSGPIGVHDYKAVYRANNSYSSSTSSAVSYSVTGTYASATTLASSGIPGNYTLKGNVVGIGSQNAGPTGTVSFLDTSVGNQLLGKETLNVSTVSNTFSQNQPFAVGGALAKSRSVAIASAYLNADNNLDVVTGDFAQTITVLLGNGDGTFQQGQTYPGCTAGIAKKIILADFNRDGNTDIALGCTDGTNGGLDILLGNGDGTFNPPIAYATGDVFSIALGDFNNDGIFDIAVTDELQGNITIFTGVGDGTFTTAGPTITITSPLQAHGIAVGDFNGDGNDDIAYAITSSVSGSKLSDLYVALGNGAGGFGVPTLVAQNIGEFLVAGDANADNIPDLVSTTITKPGTGTPFVGNSLFVLIGNGNGTFKSPVTYVSDVPSDPHFVDVNGDGIPDIIAGGSTGALVYLGNGDGTFQPYQEPTIGGFALTYAVNAGDYNNDGNADLIGTDTGTPRAAVALSQVQQTSNASALTSVSVFPLGTGVHQVDASYSGDSIYLVSLSSTVPLTAEPVPTTLALTVSPTSGTLSGQAVTLTATLSPYTVGPPTTTTDGETIIFYNGGTSLGTGTLNKGVATLVTSSLPVGPEPLQASFAGDANYKASSSTVLIVTISSIMVTSSLNPSVYLQPVTFTATFVAGKSGTVSFMDGATLLGTSSVGGTTSTLTTSSLSTGSHDITAIYDSSTSPVLVQVVNKATPVVTVTTSGPSNFGDTVTIKASVPSGVTGTITFANGTTTLGSGTISSGAVTITTATLPAGSDTITATYSGDTNYTQATGSAVQTVGKLTPTITVTTSGPSTYGAPVQITASLPTGATGTITFTSGGLTLGSGSIASGSVTITSSTLPGGTDTITASYGGDTNYNSATGTAQQTVSKLSTTVTLASSLNPSTVDQSVMFTATVPNGIAGTVTFTSGTTTIGTQTITGKTAAVTTSSLPAGSDPITATYNGNTNYNSATASLTQTVNKATPTVTVTTSGPSSYGAPVKITATVPSDATGTIIMTSGGVTLGSGSVTAGAVSITTTVLPVGTDTITASYGGDSNYNSAKGSTTEAVTKASPVLTLTSSINPSVVSQSVIFTATLPATASGSVTFKSGATALGTASIVNGIAAVTTSTLPIGSDPISAAYAGDTNNNATTASITQIVNKAAPTVSVTTSGPSTYGGSVTITTTLPPGTTGTVTVTSGGTTLGTGTINSGGTVTITTTSLPVGTDPIVASYGGDTNNNPATGTTSQTVGKDTPVLPIPVVSSTSPIVGTPVTITETVPPGVSGPVTFSDGSNPIGTAPIVGGVATITVSNLPLGANPITASTPGDANNNPATSPAVSVTVGKTAPEITLTSSANPSTVGQSVTFTATAPTGATGTITFLDGATAIGTGNLINGQATLTTSSLTTGSHTITASYSGDAKNSAGVSDPLTQYVNKATPTITVTTSGPSTSGKPVTITTTLPIGTTGTVVVTSGGVTLGSGTVSANGTVTITTTALPIGTDTITASYGGDSNNNPAVGTAIQTVSKASATVTLTSSLNPSSPNTPVTFSATVYAGASGPVTFLDGSAVLGMGTVNAAGVATFTTSSLAIGSHPITATYGGDSTYSSATSAVLTQVIGTIPTTISLSESTPAQLLNTLVTFTAVVTASSPTPTGTVSFLDGTTVLGTAPVTTGGSVVVSLTVGSSYQTSTLADGAHQITAVYSGDSTFTTSTSASITNTVEDFTNVNSGPASQEVAPGKTTTFNFKLTPVGASTFLDDVTLTVTGLPMGSTYTVTPASITSGSGETGVVVSVTASSSISAQNRVPQDGPGSHREVPVALGMLGLAGLGTVRKFRKKLPRPLLLLILMIASILPIAALSGCAGGYFAPDPHTYTVTLTSTEGSIQHTATATLVVQ